MLVLKKVAKKQKVEMFSVCDKKIRIEVSFKDLKNQMKWHSGWVEIVD